MNPTPDPRIAVLMSIDDAFVTALEVTVTSVLDHLRPDAGLDLYIMANGVSEDSCRGVEQTLAAQTLTRQCCPDRLAIHWLSFDERKLAALEDLHPAPLAANLRLLAGSCLPASLWKVIYLDADVLVRGDLCELWDQDFEGNVAMAVQDAYLQRFPARELRHPAPGAEQWPYFNSGVLVIDLEAWREGNLEQRCIQSAMQLPRWTKWLDQQVLNICLAGRWKALPPVWNKQYFLDLFPDWQSSPYTDLEFEEARASPRIVHFSSRTKPWYPVCDHLPEEVAEYRDLMKRLRRPGKGPMPYMLHPTVAFFDFFSRPHRRVLDMSSAVMRARQRSHAAKKMIPRILGTALLHPWTLLTIPLQLVLERIIVSWKGLRTVSRPQHSSVKETL